MEQTHTSRERLLADAEQRYLNLLQRHLHGQIDAIGFRHVLRRRWAEEREALWPAALGDAPRDFRPLTRLLDRLDAVCAQIGEADRLRVELITLKGEFTAAKHGDPNSALSRPPRVNLFERPLPDGWVYPCTVEDIRQQLALVPEHHLEGLWSVGLAPATRQDKNCYGTYWYRSWRMRVPTIHIYPCPLSLRTRARYSFGELERLYSEQLSYGMRIERGGGHLVCHWEAECLRRYVSEHVLLHEIGHHVQRRQRGRAGLSPFPGHTASEQFAEDYARRVVRERRCRGK